MATLLEAYAKRLSYSDGVYAKYHEGETLSESKKITIAKVLDNTAKFLNESFSNSVGTQRSDMGLFKKFTLDLTTVALPNLIANDLVIVKPMASMSGFVQYIKFVAGSAKGGVAVGDNFNDPWKLGDYQDERRINYTAEAIVESCTSGVAFTAAWTPIVKGVFDVSGTKYDACVTDASGNKTYGNFDASGVITPGATGKIAYKYDNVTIPQNDLPVLNAKMEGITLQAKARRIAIYYSQMAAFQAKTETGMDLNKALATQACGELSYEIDTEVVCLLRDLADEQPEEVVFNKHLPVGVSKMEHYEGFAEVIERASQHIYDRTHKHAANYMVIASDIKPILSLMRGWKAASTAKISGPYFAGEINGIKVYVSPALGVGKFFCGFNGDDLMTSAAIYAPYMAIVPTQLLGYADGGMSQGFSTLYDLKELNRCLVVKGRVVDETVSGATFQSRGEING